MCRTRNDELGDAVLGRLTYACDLPAAEACYHQNSWSNIRSGYQTPYLFLSSMKFESEFGETYSIAQISVNVDTATQVW